MEVGRPLMNSDDDVMENEVGELQYDSSNESNPETDGNQDSSGEDSPPSTIPADEPMVVDSSGSDEEEESTIQILSVRSLSGETNESRNVEDSNDIGIGNEGEPESSSLEELITTSDNVNNYYATNTWEDDDAEATEDDVTGTPVSLSYLPGHFAQHDQDVPNKRNKMEDVQKRRSVIRYCSSGKPKEVVDLTEDDDKHEVNIPPPTPTQWYPNGNESVRDLVNEQDGNSHSVETESSQPPTQVRQDTSFRTSGTGINCFNCREGHYCRQCTEPIVPERVKETEEEFFQRRRRRRDYEDRYRRVYLRKESPEPNLNNSRGYNERSGLWQTRSEYSSTQKSSGSDNTPNFQYFNNDYTYWPNRNNRSTNANVPNPLHGGAIRDTNYSRPSTPKRTKKTSDSGDVLDPDTFYDWFKQYDMYECSEAREAKKRKPVLTESTEYGEHQSTNCNNYSLHQERQERVPYQLGFNEDCPRSDRGVVNNLSQLHVTHTETRTFTGMFDSSSPRDSYNEFELRPNAPPPYPMGRGRGMVSTGRVSLIARASTASSAQFGRASTTVPATTTYKRPLSFEETVLRLLDCYEKYGGPYNVPQTEIATVPHNYHHTQEAEERYHARKKAEIAKLKEKGLPVPVHTYKTIPVYGIPAPRTPTPPENNIFQNLNLYTSISNSTQNGSKRRTKRRLKTHTAVNGNDIQISNRSSEPSQPPLNPSSERHVDENGPEESNSDPARQNHPIINSDEEDADSDIEVIQIGRIKPPCESIVLSDNET